MSTPSRESTAAAHAIDVRPATRDDIPAVLELMRALAVFEQYIDDFAVDESVIIAQSFEKSPPNFETLVAVHPEAGVVGMTVFFTIPFTYYARPALLMKELYVQEAWRSAGVGRALMKGLASEALSRGCVGIKWTVADWNERGQDFYARLGAAADRSWINYGLDEAAMRALSEDPA